MPRKFQVIESERSSSVVHANWNQKQKLQRDIGIIGRAEKMVTSRITLNQRITYKRYKQKLYQAKLNHARLMGDKKTERELRGNSNRFTFNTNFGLDPEDEEVLQKIWSASAPTPSNVRPKSSPVRLQTDPRAQSGVSIAHGGKACPRASTTLPDIKCIAKKGGYIATGGGSEAGDDSESDLELSEEEEEEEKAPKGILSHGKVSRPKTTHFAGQPSPRARAVPTGRPPRAVSVQPEPQGPNIFSDDTRPTLLDIHRERISSANFEGRVKNLCQKMKQFEVNREYLIRDYYSVRLNSEMSGIQGNKYYAKGIPGTPVSDIKRATGNTSIKSLTLKRINYDFNKPPEVVSKAAECLTA